MAIASVPDGVILALGQSLLFSLGWLIAARLMSEERAALLCWSGYNLIEGLAILTIAVSAREVGAPAALALILGVLNTVCATAGFDLFVSGRARYLPFWLAVLGVGIGIQVGAPFTPEPLALRMVGYNLCILTLLIAPIVFFVTPLKREFGPFGTLALLPVGLFALFGAILTVRLIFVPGVLERSAAQALGDVRALLPVELTVIVFNLIWFALVVGRVVMRARRLARFDSLTGLLQRAAFAAELERELDAARRYATSLSLAFIDIDRFKLINDRAGHQTGDEVLAGCARLLAACSRTCDHVGRWGGEEFVVLMPNTDEAGALRFAERFQVNLGTSGITLPAGMAPLSVSIGVATAGGDDETAERLIARADQAMYRAKARSRE